MQGVVGAVAASLTCGVPTPTPATVLGALLSVSSSVRGSYRLHHAIAFVWAPYRRPFQEASLRHACTTAPTPTSTPGGVATACLHNCADADDSIRTNGRYGRASGGWLLGRASQLLHRSFCALPLLASLPYAPPDSLTRLLLPVIESPRPSLKIFQRNSCPLLLVLEDDTRRPAGDCTLVLKVRWFGRTCWWRWVTPLLLPQAARTAQSIQQKTTHIVVQFLVLHGLLTNRAPGKVFC